MPLVRTIVRMTTQTFRQSAAATARLVYEWSYLLLHVGCDASASCVERLQQLASNAQCKFRLELQLPLGRVTNEVCRFQLVLKSSWPVCFVETVDSTIWRQIE